MQVALESIIPLTLTEPDVADDLDGLDAAQKLSILAFIGLKSEVKYQNIVRRTIKDITLLDFEYANELGYTIKQLSVVENQENMSLYLDVGPYLVNNSSIMSCVDGVVNAVLLKGEPIGHLMFHGEGVSANGTTSAVILDLLSILNEKCLHYNINNVNTNRYNTNKKSYYVRFSTSNFENLKPQLECIQNDFTVKYFKEFESIIVFVIDSTLESNLEDIISKLSKHGYIDNFIKLPIFYE